MSRPSLFGLWKKNVGITIQRVTLTHVFVLKSIVGLFLGLVLQLSQAHPYLATQTQRACVAEMSCCEDLDSCPCLSESRNDQKPSPLLPTNADLKILLSGTSEALPLETQPSPTGKLRVASASTGPCRTGYAGVPLSVAFCSFII